MKPSNLLLAFVAGIALAAGIWLAAQSGGQPPEPRRATVLPVPADLPEFSLVDQDGMPFGRERLAGQWDLLFFGFTNCPDICPLTMQVLSTARAALRENGQDPLPRIVLVSVDPERDTPGNMKAYVDAFGDGNVGVTGTVEELTQLTSALGIFFQKRETNDGQYAVDHSAVVIVIDPDARFHAIFSSPHEVETFVHDLPIVTGS